MKILLVETGRPPKPVLDQFGDYPQMMADFLSPNLPLACFETCSVIDGDRLPKTEDFGGIVILGSPHGVYDDIAWIRPLISFIQSAAKKRVAQVGICFGHQIIAKAMGGIVEKAPNGWGIGRHTYDCVKPLYSNKAFEKLNLLVSHQDQVLKKPESARILARSDFTPNAVLSYPEKNILTCQAHPEFTPEFARAIIEYRRGSRFNNEVTDKAIKSIDGQINAREFASFMAYHLLGQVSGFEQKTA